MTTMNAADTKSLTPRHVGPAADALYSLSEAMRANGLHVSAGQSFAIPDVIAQGENRQMSVACHGRLDGLHFCAPNAEGPCRELGPVTHVTEVAAVVGRELAGPKETPG